MLRFLPFLIALCLLRGVASAAELEAVVSSRFLVEGEQAELQYVLSGEGDTYTRLMVPDVPNLNIRSLGFGAEPRISYGRRREYVFRYSVISYEPGTYTIPPARLEGQGLTLTSEPIELRVAARDSLEWSQTVVGGRELKYSAAFLTTKDRPFVNEVMPAELKLYIPIEQSIEDWGIPEFERDGVAAWRFEPRPTFGRAQIGGRNYYCVSYPSSLSPTRPGPVTLGPGSLRLMTIQRSLEEFNRGAFYDPANLVIPALELEARPLPDGAPEGFEDAVGEFDLAVRASETEVHQGDPVNLTIIVSGTGNLDTLNVPKPVDAEGWKLYPASPLQRGDRRAITGSTAFRQLMRPLGTQAQVPPFRLVYFNPESETYESVASPAIPLTVLPSTLPPALGSSAPPEMPMPVEQMADILGIVTAKAPLLPVNNRLPGGLWQLIPASLAILLLIAAFRRHLAPRLRRDPDDLARKRAFRELESTGSDFRTFYRAAGHFVESWLGDSTDPTARDVLLKRDEACFREETSEASIPRSERQRILRHLRRLALPLVAFFALLPAGNARGEEGPDTEPALAAPAAYEAGRFGEAARLWLESGPYDQLPADTLYNIGNAAYRLGSPGDAALYWRRALLRDETHSEARQNLRFFERKFGSITIKRPDYQYVLARLPLAAWTRLMWAGAWLFGLGLLVFPATRPGARLRIAAISGLVTAPLIAGAGFCGWYYYPDDARFAPTTEQGVVVAERVAIRTDAARNSPTVIEAPAGSLCRILSESGDWVYVAFTNETRGWLPRSEVERLIPRGDPKAPEPRDTFDEQKSA